MIIGLTGGSGTGKSTVVKYFTDKGYILLDFDKISRDVCSQNSPCLNEIVACFDTAILTENGALNRKALGNIVFKDKEKLSLVNYPHLALCA